MSTLAQNKTRFEGVSLVQTQADDDQDLIQRSRMEEVQALLNMGCSVIVDESATEGNDYIDLVS